VLPIDAVLLSHDQLFDNLDHGGRAILPKVGRVLTTTAGAGRLRAEVPKVEGLDPWSSVTIPTKDRRRLQITATPARHGPRGFEPISGDVIGFILALDELRIYVSGDTVWYAVSPTSRVAST
jgi:L-ascorbate metabolism protein UlaG (beta-lactamase superfamily)